MWIPITLLLLLGAFTAYVHVQENEESILVLRQTIGINLSILEAELEELCRIADGAPPSPATSRANLLLEASGKVARESRQALLLRDASREALGKLLALVFHAMNQSAEARRLLDACSVFFPDST